MKVGEHYMPYININEYDNTITGTKTTSNNIVAVPINASDGPSDRWVTCHTYDSFVQTFGSDPLPNGDFGSSWQYAANLLMRNMSVCVRRITHEIDENGNNGDLLSGVSIAKAIVKVKQINTDNTSSNSDLQKDELAINVPNINNTKLILSDKGETIQNPLYKTNNNTVEGQTSNTTFSTPLELEAATLDVTSNGKQTEKSGTFADVEYTSSEWSYCGPVDNPHYKYNVKNEATKMSDIIKNNPSGVTGDFYVNEDDHVVIYSSVSENNQNWLSLMSVNYPDQLVEKKGINEESFVDVKYDINGNEVNKVWLYTPHSTTKVPNHYYVANPNNTTDGSFESEEELNTYAKTIKSKLSESDAAQYFAEITGINKLYTYNVKSKTFGQSTYSTGELTTTGIHGKERDINFTSTDSDVNTGLYRHKVNWINTGESGEVTNGLEQAYSDPIYKELVFTKLIHWVNTENAINTTSHTTVEGTTRNINSLILSKKSDLINSTVSLQLVTYDSDLMKTNFNNVVIKDNDSKHRLTSGIFGLVNTSLYPIRIYSYKITQKLDSSNVATSEIYDMNIEKATNITDIINKDSLVVFKDNDGNVIENPTINFDYVDEKPYIELQAGYSVYYSANLSNASLQVQFTGFDEIGLTTQLFKSVEGEYDLNLSSVNTITGVRYSIKEVTETETIDYDNYDVNDGYGNINMFKVEYIYPGSNGNNISVKLQTIQSRGIYLLVYRNNQFLEQIELCNFRHRLSNNKVITLDLELNKVEMWRLLLSNFGIAVNSVTGEYDSNLSSIVPITGRYVSIYFNENIIQNGLNTLDYITLLYGQIKQGISNSNTFKLQTGKDPLDDHVKHEIPNCYIPLTDKYRYNITFVSNGGYVDNIIYPNDLIAYYNGTGSAYRLIEDAMLDLVDSRKDCVAFLDVPYNLPIESVPSYFSHLSTSYAAAYDPWGLVSLATGVTKWMPPSFIQLYTHAKSILNGNKMYLPPAGVRRAMVTDVIKTNHELSSKYISEWQDSDTPQFINPIIWINGYDYTIYGQKTLFSIVNTSEKYQSALQDLNVRLVANTVKKLIWAACINLTFELNTLMTWNEFKAKLEPELSTMLGEGTLTDYEIIMDESTMTQADLNSGHVCGTVRLAITRAATDWDINLIIEPNTVTFNEIDYGSTYSE